MTHEAFFYSSEEEFAARVVPFLRDGFAADQAVIAVTTEARITLLRQQLGRDADAVSFFDAALWYRRPGAALVALRDALDQQSRGGGNFVRAVGELQFDGGKGGIRNWTRYESLVNRAFAGRPVWIMCPYNTETVPDEILAEARRAHPIVSTLATRTASPSHFGAQELAADLAPAGDRREAQERSRVEVSQPHDLTNVRRSVRWEAQSAGLSVDVVDDLLLAITELAQRWLAEDGTTALVKTARQNGEWFCEIRSDRPGSGALRTGPDDVGILIGRVISDGVEVADDRQGSVVRFIFGKQSTDPRARIIAAASELFRANGVRTTGINTVIAHAGVAKATFYAHFQSKEELIRFWLGSPVVRWFDQVWAEIETRSRTPAERLTTFFDVLGEWLTEDGFHGCPFLNTATEFRNADHAFSQELADQMSEIEDYFRRTAAEAGFADPDGVAKQLFLLVPGTITTAAARGSAEPARVARTAAADLLATAAFPS
jgi:AcrR family transcriptional regulator